MAEDAAAVVSEVAVPEVVAAPAAAEVVGACAASAPPPSRPSAPHAPLPPPMPPPGPNEALRRVLAKALVVDGVRRGLHESLKALAKGTRDGSGNVPEGGARVAILAKSQTEGDGKQLQKLVKHLALEKGCPLFEIEQASELGEWCVAWERRRKRARARLSLFFSARRLQPFLFPYAPSRHIFADPSSPPAAGSACARSTRRASRARLCPRRAPSSPTLARRAASSRSSWTS